MSIIRCELGSSRKIFATLMIFIEKLCVEFCFQVICVPMCMCNTNIYNYLHLKKTHTYRNNKKISSVLPYSTYFFQFASRNFCRIICANNFGNIGENMDYFGSVFYQSLILFTSFRSGFGEVS